jgi:ribosomal protein L21
VERKEQKAVKAQVEEKARTQKVRIQKEKNNKSQTGTCTVPVFCGWH